MASLLTAKTVHCIGIKGAGVAALAIILHEHGAEVCGSDTEEHFFTEKILEGGDISCEAFGAHDLSEVDAVVYSTAWRTSPEVEDARQKGKAVFSYPEALAELLAAAATGIAVCGTHGKTTVTAMLAVVMETLGLHPTAIVGSTMVQLGRNALLGDLSKVVVEADEYENKLQLYAPHAAIITNIEYDHPDFFKNSEDYAAAFSRFATGNVKDFVVACWDDAGVRHAVTGLPAGKLVTYGWDSGCTYAARDYRIENDRPTCDISAHGIPLGTLSLPLVGRHNLTNALAVVALCATMQYGPMETVLRVLGEFRGTARRFERKGQLGATIVFDDYAHHPTEVRTTLHAARHHYPEKRIWCVFGPHTYSRTEALFSQFARSFHHARKALILDIYSSAREAKGTVSSKDLVDAINDVSGNAVYTPTIDAAVKEILAHKDEIDILITIGAGDVWQVAEKLLT